MHNIRVIISIWLILLRVFAIKELPDSATFEDFLDVIFVQQRIALSLKQSNNGEVISNEAMLEKFKQIRLNRGKIQWLFSLFLNKFK